MSYLFSFSECMCDIANLSHMPTAYGHHVGPWV